MSDFLTTLAARGLGATASLAPRPASRFELPAAPAVPADPATPADPAAPPPAEPRGSATTPLDPAAASPTSGATPRAEAPAARAEQERMDESPGPALSPPPWTARADRSRGEDRGDSNRIPPPAPRAADPRPVPVDRAPEPAAGVGRVAATVSTPAAGSLRRAPSEPGTGSLRPAGAVDDARDTARGDGPTPALEPGSPSRERSPDPAPPRASRERPDAPLPVLTPRLDPLPPPARPRLVPAGPDATSGEPGAEAAAPVIRVTIGRIEVRASQSAAPAPAPRPSGPPRLSLDEYLRSGPRRRP